MLGVVSSSSGSVLLCAATKATGNNGNRVHDTLTNLLRILSHWQRSIDPETNETMRKWKTASLLHFIRTIILLRIHLLFQTTYIMWTTRTHTRYARYGLGMDHSSAHQCDADADYTVGKKIIVENSYLFSINIDLEAYLSPESVPSRRRQKFNESVLVSGLALLLGLIALIK